MQPEEIFVNGERQILTRYPNFDSKAQYFDGFTSGAGIQRRAARLANPAGGYLHAMHPALWGDFTWQITGKDKNGNLTKVGGWQNNCGGDINERIQFAENILEELDTPGEWFLNSKTHTLYFYPAAELVPDPAAARRQLKLLYLSCGNKDGLISVCEGVHVYLKQHDVPHIWNVDDHTHDRKT